VLKGKYVETNKWRTFVLKHNWKARMSSILHSCDSLNIAVLETAAPLLLALKR